MGTALEDRTTPLIKQVEELHGFLILDMGRAVTQLVQIIKTLEAYAKTGKAGREGAPS